MNKDSSRFELLPPPLAIAVVAALALSGWNSGANPSETAESTPPAEPAEIFSRAPYLQLATPESIFIVWRTSEKIDPVVKFGSSPESLDRKTDNIEVRQTAGDNSDGKKLILSGGKQKLPRDGTGQSVYVRAEDVQISEKGPLTGQVENVTFLGTHYRIGVKGIAPDLLTSILVGQTAPNIGDTVSVSIHPDSLLILPKGADEE